MKSISRFLLLLFGISALFSAHPGSSAEKPIVDELSGIDAYQAMAIANQWRWSQRDVKSYVTPREVVFKFSDGRVKSIPLPEEKMLVAVAPYIDRTHR